jgi:hypothetical protein
MASTLSRSYRNLPASATETSALQKLLDRDLEFRSSILRRQEEVQADCSYTQQAAEVFEQCLATTSAVKDACEASILSTKALKEALKNALNFYDGHMEVLATLPSTKRILATWADLVPLTETLIVHLDKATPQVGIHLHLAADEHAAHECAHIASSQSLLFYTNSLRAIDESIAQKRTGLRALPTEILRQIFVAAVDARQSEITNSLSSYYEAEPPYSVLDSRCVIDSLLTTLNLVPFTLSATCKRWRTICQFTARMWRYARVPTIVPSHPNKETIVGKTQFERCVHLAQKQPLELTIYGFYNLIHQGATYSNFVFPAESQTLRVNLVWHSNRAIPSGVPSPTELCIVASVNSRTPYAQALPLELLANTKKLRCTGLTPQINQPVGVQSLHILVHSFKRLPPFESFLQNCPQLKELHVEMSALPSLVTASVFTLQQLHTLCLTGVALHWVTVSFLGGCCLPGLRCLVLTDINGFRPCGDISYTHGQFSHITHIEVRAVSEPAVVAQFRPLFDIVPALCTLTLVGSAVEPMLKLLTSPAPREVQELIIRDSDASGTTLRDYLRAIEGNGGDTSGVEVAWKNCPGFSGEYGKAFGELHL